MIRVAIVGAAGYAGIELVRLVLGHPEMRLVAATSTGDAGRTVEDVYPALAGCRVPFTEPEPSEIAAVADLVFLAIPHAAAMEIVPALLERGVRIVDLSADFRLRDPRRFEQWYGVVHAAPALLAEAVYGLPELWRARLPGARLVACAGCYPTAALLAAAPAVEAGVVESAHVIVDAKSGVSGAGRSPSAATHFVAVNESVSAYQAAAHRHAPEMEQGLADAGLAGAEVTFVPHLVPMTRGLLASVYLKLFPGVDLGSVHRIYTHRYAEEPFVTVHPPGRMPATGEVAGSNRAHLGLALDERSRTLVVTCAIDNLVKGAAGQALQCANVTLGLPETMGLDALPAVV